MLHIYSEELQPATDYKDHSFDPPMPFKTAPDEKVWCRCCDESRPASDAVVACYYDGHVFFCADGKGCKDPVFIAAKKQRAFENRSNGQKRRHANR